MSTHITPYQSPEARLDQVSQPAAPTVKETLRVGFPFLLVLRWLAIAWCLFDGSSQLIRLVTNWALFLDRSLISPALNPYFWLISAIAVFAIGVFLIRPSRWVFVALAIKISCYLWMSLVWSQTSFLDTITTRTWLIQGALVALCFQLWLKKRLR